ncbi:MAG: phosphatase PAP2 family protein [Candidatus Geothermarchaeales archaeon]
MVAERAFGTYILLFLLGMGAFSLVVLVALAGGGPLLGDEEILELVQMWEIGDVLPRQVVFESASIVAAVVMAVVLWRRVSRSVGIATLVASTAPLPGYLFKQAVGRPRPLSVVVLGDPYSFPSNSTLLAAAVGLWMVILALRYREPLYGAVAAVTLVLAVLMGIQRLAVGEHWPSDVVGAWLTAGVWVILVRAGSDRA